MFVVASSAGLIETLILYVSGFPSSSELQPELEALDSFRSGFLIV